MGRVAEALGGQRRRLSVAETLGSNPASIVNRREGGNARSAQEKDSDRIGAGSAPPTPGNLVKAASNAAQFLGPSGFVTGVIKAVANQVTGGAVPGPLQNLDGHLSYNDLSAAEKARVDAANKRNGTGSVELDRIRRERVEVDDSKKRAEKVSGTGRAAGVVGDRPGSRGASGRSSDGPTAPGKKSGLF